MSRPDFVTLVIHHPLRPLTCLLGCLHSLRTATNASHTVTLFVQGLRDDITIDELVDHVAPARLEVVCFAEHMGPVVPRILSLDRARDLRPKWWCKLDDDAALHPGSWDALAEAIEHDGADAFCAMANPNGTMVPRDFRITGSALLLEDRQEAPVVRVRPGLSYRACDFVGDGATVFRAQPFTEDGFCFDRDFERGADLDLLYAAHAFGYHALLCSPPNSLHNHVACACQAYDSVRYDARPVWRAAAAFRRKWKLDCPHLSQFGVGVLQGAR